MTGEGQEGASAQQGINRRSFFKLSLSGGLAAFLAACGIRPSSSSDVRFLPQEFPQHFETGDIPFLLPQVARDPVNFQPLAGIPEPPNIGLIEPVVVRFPPEAAQILNLDTVGTVRLMGLAEYDGREILVPVVRYSPSAFEQINGLSQATQPREIPISTDSFLESLFRNPEIGVSLRSSELHNGFRVDRQGGSIMVGGPKQTADYTLRIIEPRALPGQRIAIAQIIEGDTVLGYRTVSMGVVPSGYRGAEYHYQLRHGTDGLALSKSPVTQFVYHLPETLKANAKLLEQGKPAGPLTPLILLKSPGRPTYILSQAEQRSLNFGPVLSFHRGEGYVHGFRPGMTASVIEGVNSAGHYTTALEIMAGRIFDLQSRGLTVEVTMTTNKGPVRIDAQKFVGMPLEEMFELLRSSVASEKIPPAKTGLRRWSGWPKAGLVGKVGGPVLSFASGLPFGLMFGLNRYGECTSFAQCTDVALAVSLSRFSSEIPWMASAEIGTNALNDWIEQAKAADKEHKPRPLFITVNKQSLLAERSGDNPGGIWFSVNPEEIAVDKLNVHAQDDLAETYLFYPKDQEEIQLEPTMPNEQLSVPTTFVDKLPSKDDFFLAIAGSVVKARLPDFAYRKISSPQNFITGKPSVFVNYYLATFVSSDGTQVTHVLKDSEMLAMKERPVIISTIMAKLMREKNGDTDGPSVEIDMGMLDDAAVTQKIINRFSSKPAGTPVTFPGVFSPEVPEGEEEHGEPEFRPEEHLMFEHWGVVIKRLMRAGVLIQPEEGVARYFLAPRHLKPQAESK